MTTTTNPIAISVLLRTFNSGKTLDRVMDKLKLVEGDEFIVVDSGSTDSTLAVATARGARIVPAAGPFNYSKSLNLGFRSAHNPWVLVISSHAIPVPSDLLAIYRDVARALPARTMVAYGASTLDGRGPYQDDSVRNYNQDEYQAVAGYCGNGNALYRRSSWEEVPFDESIRTGEDRAWLDEIFKRGYAIAFASAANTLNLSQYSLRYMFRKGYSDIRAEPHHPKSLRDLFLGLGSLTKRFLRGGMPTQNWIRYSAHVFGQYFGSHQPQDNTPGK